MCPEMIAKQAEVNSGKWIDLRMSTGRRREVPSER